MRIRIEQIKLKPFINEATYTDVFNQIKGGDVLIIKTGKQVYKAEVINKFSNQITINWNNNLYLLTNNSFDGSQLETHRLVTGEDGKTKRTVKGPTIKGVYNIIVQRDNKTIAGVTPTKGRSPEQSNKNKETKTEYQERYNDLVSQMNNFEEGDVMMITTGKLITSGADKGGLAKNTITTLKFYVQKKGGKLWFMKLYDVNGFDASKYESIQKHTFAFGPESLGVTEEGIMLNMMYKDSDGKMNKIQLPNVFGIENAGKFDEMPQVDMEDIMNSPRLRAIMYKNPSLLDKLLGRGPKGIIPLADKLKNLGARPTYKKTGKVKFKFYGEPIRQEYRFNFTNGEMYVGRFTKPDVIKRSSDSPRESMYLRMVETIGEEEYKVDVIYDKIVDGKSNPQKVGDGKIKIIGTNY